MWTICWTNAKDGDKWERLEFREDVEKLVENLTKSGKFCEDDILIFPPEADDFTIPCDDIINKTEE